jgi:hypothetical protein
MRRRGLSAPFAQRAQRLPLPPTIADYHPWAHAPPVTAQLLIGGPAPEVYDGCMPDDVQAEGVDLSGLHREIDRLKAQLCHCRFEGTCVGCRGFEMLRENSQMVVAAARQPILVQVAQEASVNDLMARMGDAQEKMAGVQEKLADDPKLQDMVQQMMARIQDDLGPEAMESLQQMFNGMAGDMNPFGGPGGGPVPPDDRNT